MENNTNGPRYEAASIEMVFEIPANVTDPKAYARARMEEYKRWIIANAPAADLTCPEDISVS